MRWKVKAWNSETNEYRTVHVEARRDRLEECIEDGLGPEWVIHRCKLDPAPAGHRPEHRQELERRRDQIQEHRNALYTILHEYPSDSLERKRLAEASNLLRQAFGKLEQALATADPDAA